jgi:tetratricopeptide (TPR) repeat protein
MPVRATNDFRYAANLRRERFPVAYSVSLAVLLVAVLPCSQSMAQSKNAPWQQYMDAAAEANATGDFAGADVLLNSALQLAETVDASGPRPVLTKLVLHLNYLDLGRKDIVKSMAKENLRLDVSSFDREVLLFTRTLTRLANLYYDRWKKENNEVRLEQAQRCLLIKWAIQQKLLPKNSPDLAETMGYQGLISMKQRQWPQAIEKFQDALKVWGEIEKSAARLAAGGRIFSLFASQSPGSDQQESSDPVAVKLLLGSSYKMLGDELREKKQENEARNAYRNAEGQMTAAAHTWLQRWPNHKYTANVTWYLGDVCAAQGRHTEAESWYRRTLAIYESTEGPDGSNVASVVKDLASVLRKTNRSREAKLLEDRYHVHGEGAATSQ